MILARTGSGSHHYCLTSDGGQSWTDPKPTTLLAGCSPLTLKRMPDGRMIVLYNHGKPKKLGDLFPRSALHYCVSADEGVSWSEPVLIDDQRESGYPGVCFLAEGILLTYGGDEIRKCCVIEYP